MKYSFNYNRRSTVLSQLDEINVKVDPTELEVLFNYIKEHKHQRINAKIKEQDHIFDYDLLNKFEDFKLDNADVNFTIVLPKYDLNLAQICKQKNLKFFFDSVIRDWETFNAYVSAGPTDVYLVEQMMFEIKDAAAAAHEKGIAIRTFPNIAQRRYEETIALKTFFIRPEDVNLYEGLVDVMELYTMAEINTDIVFQIYKLDKYWWGPIKEIIIGLDSDIDGRYIIPRFGERRLNCNRKCFKGQKCDICGTCEEISQKLQKAGILIEYEKMIKDKEKEEEEDG